LFRGPSFPRVNVREGTARAAADVKSPKPAVMI
jgi:hypothetical protein